MGSKRRAVVQMGREDLQQLVLDLVGRLPQVRVGKSFGELAADWFARIAKRRVHPGNERRHVRHMLSLTKLREGELTKGVIDELFSELLGRFGPATINKFRSTGRLIIRDAQGNNEWTGLNPFELVARMKETKRVYLTLNRAEVAKVLPELRVDRRRLSKTILMVGLRPGEALGLLKVDVDLKHKMLKVRRSHGRNQTKTGKERTFPIPDELVKDLRDAMRESRSEYVFPKPDGTRQRADTKLARMLRTAIAAAGLITGYWYTCRRQGCGHREQRAGKKRLLDCPDCGFRLWWAPIAKHLRFYDLRHSSATLHRKAKCDPMVIQDLLGHAMNITDGTYTHLDEDYKRMELNKLKLG